MKAQILVIGNEILNGKTLDTNSKVLAKELTKVGLDIQQIVAISDNQKTIISYLDKALTNAEFIFITGGLGPTSDDVTKQTLNDYFGYDLSMNQEVLAHIKSMFKNRYNSPINEQNIKQAMLPKQARIFINEYGTASGMWFKKNNSHCISLPGVPHEMKHLLVGQIVPTIKSEFNLPQNYIRTVNTIGLGESNIADRLTHWEKNLHPKISVAYLPDLGKVRIRVSTSDKDFQNAQLHINRAIDQLLPLIQDIYYGQDDRPIENVVAELLTEKSLTISCAESYTGGAIANQITSIPGASAYFKGGLVVYNDDVKTDLLGIPKSIIQKLGPANETIVEQMALGTQRRFETDIALATSGNAGPTQGDINVPVGTVFIGLAIMKKVETFEFKMNGPRKQVIERSLNKINELLFHHLK